MLRKKDQEHSFGNLKKVPNNIGVHTFNMDKDLNYVAKSFEVFCGYR